MYIKRTYIDIVRKKLFNMYIVFYLKVIKKIMLLINADEFEVYINK